MVQLETPSPSRSRRTRAAATKRHLFDLSQTPQDFTAVQSKLTTMETSVQNLRDSFQSSALPERLDKVEWMLHQLHWAFLGQWNFVPFADGYSGPAVDVTEFQNSARRNAVTAKPVEQNPEYATNAKSNTCSNAVPPSVHISKDKQTDNDEEGWLSSDAEVDIEADADAINLHTKSWLPFVSGQGHSGDFRVLPRLAWESLYAQFPPCRTQTSFQETAETSTTDCTKCREKIEDCICFDVFCRRCMRLATQCDCIDSITRYAKCPSCGSIPWTESLYDDKPLGRISEIIVCQHCSMSYDPITKDAMEFFSLQGASACCECLKVDAQEALENCEFCESLKHTFCMKLLPRPGDDFLHGMVYCCRECENAGAFGIGSQASSKPAGNEESDERLSVMSAFEKRMNILIDFIDAADSGKVQVPKAIRNLAEAVAKDMYTWFWKSPPTSEIQPKVNYLDGILQKIAKRAESKDE